jgi:hypothetical protein
MKWDMGRGRRNSLNFGRPAVRNEKQIGRGANRRVLAIQGFQPCAGDGGMERHPWTPAGSLTLECRHAGTVCCNGGFDRDLPMIDLFVDMAENSSMTTETPARRRLWSRIARYTAIALAMALASLLAFGSWKYLRWQNQFIEWDRGSIHRVFGGEAEEDRIRKIEFVRRWEYKALKRTSDGKNVWLHVKLSKRHCGNWMLVDQNQSDLVRPLEARYPNGLPPRAGAVDCLEIPLDYD